MVRTRMILIAALALSCGCGGEESDGAAAEEPAAVRPVEVVADEEGGEAEEEAGDGEELTRLRARVTELEAQLTECQRNVPTGVDPPPTVTTATPRDAGVRDAGVRRDAGPRRLRDQTIRIPDPTGILLGP